MTEEEKPKHHKLGPSSLKYVEICPGFRNTDNDEPHPVAVEGTMLHEACETGDMSKCDDDQMVLVGKCLDYVDHHTKGADKIHRELRLEISYDTRGHLISADDTPF